MHVSVVQAAVVFFPLPTSCNENIFNQVKRGKSQPLPHFFFLSPVVVLELCLKESLCMGLSSKLLLDASGTPEVDSISSLTDRGRESNLALTKHVRSRRFSR